VVSKSDLDTDVLAIGELMGLLTESGDAVSINTGWFGGPIAHLEAIDTRLDRLVAILSSFLGPGVQNPPDVFPGAQWYPLPNPNTGGATAFHAVMPSETATSGQIGLGVLYPLGVGNLTIQAFLYVPLFSYSPSGAQFIAAGQSNPCLIGLYVTTSDTFRVDGVSFTAMKIDAGISLADQAPTFTLTFEDLQGSSAPGTYTTLQSLLDPTVDSWIGEVIVQGSYWLHLYVGSSPYTVGDLLTAAHFLTEDDQGEYHLSLQNLQGQSATEIALNFVFAALDALSTLEVPLIPLPGGGVFIAKRQSDNAYGIRFAADLSLSPNPNGGGEAPPAVDVSLGTWLTGESAASNWIGQITGANVAPGLSLYVLKQNGSSLSFAPSFELTSVGITIQGGGDAPLIDLGGYTLQGAEIRTYLDSADWTYGFAVRLDDVGFPLGTSFQNAQAGAANTNVVVQNLLASGGQSGDTSQPGAVNPSFSATAGYVKGHPPLLEIYDAHGNQTDLIWFPVQRRFGPINCQKVGLRVDVTGAHQDDPLLSVVFDGDVSLAVLDVYLDQLSINVRLKDVANPSGYGFDLQGLDLTFNSPDVEVSGGLLKVVDTSGSISYDGEALIKFTELALSAVGSYSSLPNNGGTSLFIFAILNGPIGGPGFFYITGIAAGFGYNRALKIPAQSDVQTFPLIAAMANTSLIGGNNPSPATVLSSLQQWVPPQRGEYWLAAGLQFTTFEIINTNALLIVEFGKEFVIAVLGLSTLRQPQIGDAYVYAELEIEVVFSPQTGEIKASAVLSPSSYVLTPDAHLSGGFAFYAWFGSNQHAGDFVFTMGGYHPAFTVPDYYPQEPRVGVNWQISDKLAMVGDAYLAITPTAMMAGAGLQLTFDDGPLKAWLKAQADAILFWKPFYLIADVSISVGVSYRIDVLFVHATLSVELGADFHLWGPPIGGQVHIDWYIIAFTIGFGSPMQIPTEITWDDFKALLPSKTEQQQTTAAASLTRMAAEAMAVARETVAAATTTTTTTPAYLSIRVNQGLKTTHVLDGLTLWLVRANQFQFSVDSAIPASQIAVESENPANNATIQGSKVGIRRVNGDISPDAYQSTQTVTILQLSSDNLAHIQACMATSSPCTGQPASCPDKPIDITGWDVEAVQKNLPQAMWGAPVAPGQDPAINTSSATVPATIGLTMSPKGPAVTNCTPQMVIDQVFADRTVNADDEYRLPLSQTQQPSSTTPVAADSFADIAHVNDAEVVQNRTALFTALQELGINGWTNDALPAMAATPGGDFADEPLEAVGLAG